MVSWHFIFIRSDEFLYFFVRYMKLIRYSILYMVNMLQITEKLKTINEQSEEILQLQQKVECVINNLSEVTQLKDAEELNKTELAE